MERQTLKRNSLRQITVLTVAGLLSPIVQTLPGRLAQRAGGLAWLAPLLALPAALVWGGLLCACFREEGMDLAGMARREFGKGFGRALALLYIVWIVALLAGQWNRTLTRMEGLEPGWGWLTAGLTVLLAWNSVRRGAGAVCRAAQIFWLALSVILAVVLALSVPRTELALLAPRPGDWGGLPGGVLDCLGVLAGGLPAAALVGDCPRKPGDGRRVLGWIGAVCLLSVGVSAAVVGQLGPALTAKLPCPFFIMVQGIGIRGGFARLEAPLTALWLTADFARFGLLFLAVSRLAGPVGGRWAVPVAAVIGVGLGSLLPAESGTVISLFFGAILPIRLWIRAWFRRKRGEK